MGSFNIACGVTGVSIGEQDPVAAVFMKRTDPRSLRNRTNMRLVRITDLYTPIAPPVYGIYNDYGRIINFNESSPTRSYIEKKFAMPLETFWEVLNYGVDRIYQDKEGYLASNFLLPGVMEAMEKEGEEAFLALGFSKSKDDTYTHPAGVSLSIENGNEVQDEYGRLMGTTFYIGGIIDYIARSRGIWIGLDPSKANLLKELSTIHIMTFQPKLVERTLATMAEDKWMAEDLANIEKRIKEQFEGRGRWEKPVNNMFPAPTYGYPAEDMGFFADLPNFSETLIQQFRLEYLMHAVSRHYTPVLVGEQFGNPEATLALAQVLVSHATELVASQEDEDDDFPDEDDDDLPV